MVIIVDKTLSSFVIMYVFCCICTKSVTNHNFAVRPTFVFSNDIILFDEKFTLLGLDVFINCSVSYGTEYNITSWLFDNDPLLINQMSKFSQNASGLIIYNVTELNEGNYTCYVDQLKAYILVQVECKICSCVHMINSY